MSQTELGTYTSRKIEQQMCAAVSNMRYWKDSNTEVSIAESNMPGHTGRWAVIRLHGHVIAEYSPDRRIGEPALNVNVDTLRQWPSNTTLSRLRALGARVCRRNHVVHLDGQPL